MRFEVYDVDGKGASRELSMIGQAEFALASVMGAPNLTYIHDLKVPGNPKSRGKVVIRAE